MGTHTYIKVRAVYHEGVLTVLDPVTLPDGARVQLDIHLQEQAPGQQGAAQYPTMLIPATELDTLTGIVTAGGDALTDSEALYDPD